MRWLSSRLFPPKAREVTSMLKCPPPPLTSARESGIRLSIASLSASTTEPWKSVGWSVGWDDMLTCFVSLVAWNRGIDALRPRVDSALEVRSEERRVGQEG